MESLGDPSLLINKEASSQDLPSPAQGWRGQVLAKFAAQPRGARAHLACVLVDREASGVALRMVRKLGQHGSWAIRCLCDNSGRHKGKSDLPPTMKLLEKHCKCGLAVFAGKGWTCLLLAAGASSWRLADGCCHCFAGCWLLVQRDSALDCWLLAADVYLTQRAND